MLLGACTSLPAIMGAGDAAFSHSTAPESSEAEPLVDAGDSDTDFRREHNSDQVLRP